MPLKVGDKFYGAHILNGTIVVEETWLESLTPKTATVEPRLQGWNYRGQYKHEMLEARPRTPKEAVEALRDSITKLRDKCEAEMERFDTMRETCAGWLETQA